LQEYAIEADGPHRWLVFDTAGSWLGTVDTPARFTLNEIGADYILGVVRDSLDVQYVQMYRLEKPRRR
jgi:long-subunit acyl-CoA synthetase (AMP-forming)